jgi:hypothetical protein
MVSDAPSIFHPLQEDGAFEEAFLRARPAMKALLDEFVSLLRKNSKVWAVYATEDHWGLTVWTCVDSRERTDRSPVYAAEWQLLSRYPEVPFDFNVLLCPAGSEQFNVGDFDYVYTR